MKTTTLLLLVLITIGCSKEISTTVETGKVEIITTKSISKGFAYCSAVIASFGDSAVYAHALPESYSHEITLPLIWEGKIYNDGAVTSPNAVKRILNITDSLKVDRKRLRFYVIAGCDERGLAEIIPSIKHYNLKTELVKLDKTFTNSEVLRDISFDPKTKELIVRKQS